LATGAAAAGPAPWRRAPTPGVASYRYDVREIVGATTRGYRTDYRIRVRGDGRVVAEIVSVQTLDGKGFTPVTVDPACAAAMHARPGELATVQLFPLSPEQAKLGDAFLAPCAPAGVFFPLTDILNVALIQASKTFHLDSLNKVGQVSDFPGFSTSLDRAGVAMAEESPGGKITLQSLEGGRATLDWAPNPAALHLVEQNAGPPVKLDGTEHFAFRLVLDAGSGWPRQADTLYDDLDMRVAVPGLPPDKLPKVAIKRLVSIVRVMP
jgi:hypothetical protein